MMNMHSDLGISARPYVAGGIDSKTGNNYQTLNQLIYLILDQVSTL